MKKGLSSSFVLSLPDGKEAEGVTTGHSIAREFVSPFSGTKYKWKNVGELIELDHTRFCHFLTEPFLYQVFRDKVLI